MRKRVCGVLLWGTSLSFLSSEAFRTDGGLRKRPATWSHSNLLSKTRLRVDDMDSGGESAEREMDLDDEIMLNEVLRENAPSELQVRMNLMGVTPLTIAGFALAFVIIILNNALGYGWASELLGLDPSGEIAIESENNNRLLRGDGNMGGGARQLQLDSKLIDARDALKPVLIEEN